LIYESFIKHKKIPRDVLEKDSEKVKKELFAKGEPI